MTGKMSWENGTSPGSDVTGHSLCHVIASRYLEEAVEPEVFRGGYLKIFKTFIKSLVGDLWTSRLVLSTMYTPSTINPNCFSMALLHLLHRVI